MPKPRARADLREQILQAALGLFSSRGYRGTTLRAVASAVGVDVALIAHYFGNKDGLFRAAVSSIAHTPEALAECLTPPQATQGRRLATAYLGLWEEPATGPTVCAIVRAAIGDDDELARARDVLLGIARHPRLSEAIAGREHGFMLALGQLLGVAIQRHLVRFAPLTPEALPLEQLVALVAPAVQSSLEARPD